MRVRSFTIEATKTINLGNYESLKIGASVDVVLEDKEDIDNAIPDAQEELRNLLQETYKAQYKEKGRR